MSVMSEMSSSVGDSATGAISCAKLQHLAAAIIADYRIKGIPCRRMFV
jgi:hypothetical protein